MRRYSVKSSIYFSCLCTHYLVVVIHLDCTGVLDWHFVDSTRVHHCWIEIDCLLTHFIITVITDGCCFQCQRFLCFFNWSIGWLSNNFFNRNICLLSWLRFGSFFFNFVLLFGSFLVIFLSSFLGILSFFLSSFSLLFLFLLKPIKLRLSDKFPDRHWVIPIIILFVRLLDLLSFTSNCKFFMTDCFIWLEDHSDSLTSFAVDMAYFWYKREIFMEGPIELNCFRIVVLYWEVDSFLLVYYTISKVDLVLFFKRKVLE